MQEYKHLSKLLYKVNGSREKLIKKLLKFSKAFSCDTKVRIILTLLLDGEKNVNEITKTIGKDITLVSHHLSDLKKLKIVKERRVGKMKFYSIDFENSKEIIEIVKALSEEF